VTEPRDAVGLEDKTKPKNPPVVVDKVDEQDYEYYEGGEMEGWFNLEQFTQDMAVAPNPSLEQSFPSIVAYDVFEIMKRW